MEPFPDELKLLLHKRYKITLKLTEENIKNCIVYEDVTLDNSAEISASFSPTKVKNVQAEKMSISKVTTLSNNLTKRS